MLRRVAFAIALTALFCGAMFTTNGCGFDGRPRPAVAITGLTGHVTDASNGMPLAGVQLSLQGKRQTTNDNGDYVFGGLTAGSAVIVATRDGFLTHELPVQLAAGELNRRDFALRRR